MKTTIYANLLLVMLGSLDCITTVIGILYFGAVESNPFLSGVVSTNLPAFVILKMTTTIFVCLIFTQAQKILMSNENKTTKAFTLTHALLKAANTGVIVFLGIVVANNLIVLSNAI